MKLLDQLEKVLTRALTEFPWDIRFSDWTGHHYHVGRGESHWYAQPLQIHIGTAAAAKVLLSMNGLGFLEKFLKGEANIKGNLYLLAAIREHLKIDLSYPQYILAFIRNWRFQNRPQARVNVTSHYDIPQDILNVYLDKCYKSYSCAFFEQPNHRPIEELTQTGTGEHDNYDSLEKAQWRKFKDAIDFIEPAGSDSLLDIGCGYGGQLLGALENKDVGKAVGWTLSQNQVEIGRQWLARFDKHRWELNHGDYREEKRVYDHVTSTGMVSHVGPRGLVPYVRQVRTLIKRGGRYIHHSLMNVEAKLPLDAEVGAAFNKKYIWPGFHWFTLKEHIKALEMNGFEVARLTDFTDHYGKTLTAWYERMMVESDHMRERMGEQTFRAWQIYLGGCAGATDSRTFRVCRVYCRAV